MFVDPNIQNKADKKVSGALIAAIIVFGFFGGCCIIGTIVEMYNARMKRIEEEKRLVKEAYLDESISSDLLEEEEPEPDCLNQFFVQFSVINNSKRLLFGRSKDGDKNLEILNGLRVFAIAWVILGHTFYYILDGPIQNISWVFDLFDSFSFSIILSAPYSVDIFFWLSGFLGAYILLCGMKKKDGKI